MQLPIGAGVAAVNLGSRYEPGAYTACMVAAGHAPAGVDPDKLLSMARMCMGEASRGSAPEASYRACEQRALGAVTIEEVPKAGPR